MSNGGAKQKFVKRVWMCSTVPIFLCGELNSTYGIHIEHTRERERRREWMNETWHNQNDTMPHRSSAKWRIQQKPKWRTKSKCGSNEWLFYRSIFVRLQMEMYKAKIYDKDRNYSSRKKDKVKNQMESKINYGFGYLTFTKWWRDIENVI